MRSAIIASLATVFVAAALSFGSSSKDDATRLLELHNGERSSRGLESLEIDPELCSYAQRHAEKMAKSGRLVHSSMSALADAAGNGNVGENSAWGQDSEDEAVSSWMGSPGHRQNILGKRFKRVGFGVKEDAKGRKYWCAVFAG